MTSQLNGQKITGWKRYSRILLWFALSVGLAVSIFTIVQELCLATACSDTASFTFFGINMGWLGIAYFSVMLVLLWFRNSYWWLDMSLAAMVFAGAGAEFRLLWIQKYIIGSWCPLCVSICCALFIAAALLLTEKALSLFSENGEKSRIFLWMAVAASMIPVGLVVSIAGVKALE